MNCDPLLAAVPVPISVIEDSADCDVGESES